MIISCKLVGQNMFFHTCSRITALFGQARRPKIIFSRTFEITAHFGQARRPKKKFSQTFNYGPKYLKLGSEAQNDFIELWTIDPNTLQCGTNMLQVDAQSSLDFGIDTLKTIFYNPLHLYLKKKTLQITKLHMIISHCTLINIMSAYLTRGRQQNFSLPIQFIIINTTHSNIRP